MSSRHCNYLSVKLARLGRWLFEMHDARRMRKQEYDLSDLEVLWDIPYIADGTKEHLLDILRPKGGEALPVIVNIHGGGLFASYNKVNTLFNCEWARRGYVVVSLSYRRLPEVSLIDQIRDVVVALRFIRDNSTRYGLNLEHCYLTADSAGALLGLFALALEGSRALQEVFGIASSGLRFRAAAFISIMLDTRRNDLLAFLRHVVVGAEDAGEAYVPYLLDPGALVGAVQLPPLQLVTSREDIIRGDTLKLERLLADSGVEHRLMDMPKGVEHRLEHVFSVQYTDWPESRDVYNEIDAFFRAVS